MEYEFGVFQPQALSHLRRSTGLIGAGLKAEKKANQMLECQWQVLVFNHISYYGKK